VQLLTLDTVRQRRLLSTVAAPGAGGDDGGWSSLQQVLAQDPSVKYSVTDNNLVFACSGHNHDSGVFGKEHLSGSKLGRSLLAEDTSTALKRHSRPSAALKILLDFTGEDLCD